MAGNTRLTITGQLVDIKRLQGPGHGPTYDPDFQGAGGPGGKFLYQTVKPGLHTSIKKIIFVVDFFQQEGINAPGAILTGNIQAALNFAEGIVDMEPTGSDAFTFGNSLSTKPFEVVIDGFSVPSTDIGYIAGTLPDSGIFGSQGYAIFIKNSATGNDVLDRAIEEGINDYTGNPLSRENFFSLQVYYKMYVNADNTIAWCRKPIDIPHPIRVPIGQVYGFNIGNMNTNLNTLGINQENADGTPFGTNDSFHASAFYFLRQGLHVGSGQTAMKLISGAFYTPKPARSFDPFDFSAHKAPGVLFNGGPGIIANQDTSRFAWNTPYPSTGSVGSSDIGEYSPSLHDQYFLATSYEIIKGGLYSTQEPVPINSSGTELCSQPEFLYGSAYHNCTNDDGTDVSSPGLLSGVLTGGDALPANIWSYKLWQRLGEYVFVLNSRGDNNTGNLQINSYGVYKSGGTIPSSANRMDPFNADKYTGTAGYSAMYFSFADLQETIPDQIDVEGCTHPAACNYNPEANIDNGTCTFPEFYIYAPSDITSSAFTVEGSSGSSLLTGAVFSIDFGDNAELDPYEGTNNPFFNGSTATTLMIYIEVSSGETVSNYNFRIFQLADDSFTAYNPVTQEALTNVSITVNDGTFAEASTGGTLTVTVTDMGVAVEEGVMTQINIVGVEVASTSWTETDTLCAVESNFFVDVNDTNITGCTDENALNYNPDANISDNDLCEYCDDANGLVSSINIAPAHNSGVLLNNSEYAALELAAGDVLPDSVNLNLNIALNQPSASMLGTNTFGIVVFDPTTVTTAAQAATAFTAFTTAATTGAPFSSDVIFTDTFNLLNTSANDNVQNYTLNYPFDVNSTGEQGYFYYVYPLQAFGRGGDQVFVLVNDGCADGDNFVLQEGVCNDCGIGITNCVEVLDPVTQFINNDLCTPTTDCGAFDTSGSVNFVPTELYTSPTGETVNCSGYFDIQVSGPAGMLFSVKVSSSTGQINNHYLTGVSGTNYSFIPEGAEGTLNSTGVTISLEEISAITGSLYAFGDYDFEFNFYIGLNINNDTFGNLVTQVGNPTTTACPETYTYSLTENDVEICGCTIQTAENYNPQATFNIYGECGEIPGCIDPTAINYNENANVSNETCQYPEYVCTDPDAINYVSEINPPYILADNTLCQYIVIFGCTDPESPNYNPLASIDNGTCIVDGEPEGPIVPPEIPDFEAFLVYLQHCLQYKGEKYFSAMLTGKTVDEDRYLHLSMINELLRKKSAACLFDGEDASNARLREFIKIVLTYCEDCRERSGILKSPYGVFQDTTYMPGTSTYTGTPILNLGGPGGISLGGGGTLGMSSSGEAGEPSG